MQLNTQSSQNISPQSGMHIQVAFELAVAGQTQPVEIKSDTSRAPEIVAPTKSPFTERGVPYSPLND